MFGRKKKATESLQNQLKRTEEVVRKLDNVNNQLIMSMMNMNQRKGVTVKK